MSLRSLTTATSTGRRANRGPAATPNAKRGTRRLANAPLACSSALQRSVGRLVLVRAWMLLWSLLWRRLLPLLHLLRLLGVFILHLLRLLLVPLLHLLFLPIVRFLF